LARLSQHFEKQCDDPDVTLPAQGQVIDDFEPTNNIHRTTKTTEIELKLLCDPERLADIASAPVVVQYSRDIGTDVDLTTTYFDTPESALRAAGYVLRIRTDGEQHAMTLKSHGNESGKAFERVEWTMAVAAGMVPDPAVLSHALPTEVFRRISGASLAPIFLTEVRRSKRMLETPLGSIELAFDSGRIVAGDRSESINEIELELIEGRIEALFELARELSNDVPLRLSLRSKSERGFDLARDTAPKIAKAREVKIGQGASLNSALGDILRCSLQHLLESQLAAEDGRNPEGMHQYRVALRSLRSVLGLVRLMAPSPQLEALLEDARRLMSGLSEARDWDVFVTQTLPSISQGCPTGTGFDALCRIAEGRRHTAQAGARSVIASARTGRFQIALALWIEQDGWRASASPKGLRLLDGPARGFVDEVLGRFHQKVLKRGRGFKALSAAKRHGLRIALKRLRYATDYFLPLWGKSKSARRYTRRLAALQAELGYYNDLVVMEQRVLQIIECRIPVAAHTAAGAMLGWRAGRLSNQEKKIQSAWMDFRSVKFL
jgi:triphosphatase